MSKRAKYRSLTSASSIGGSDGFGTLDIIGPRTTQVDVDTFIQIFLPEVSSLETRTFDVILGALVKTGGYNRIASKAFPRKHTRIAQQGHNAREGLQAIVTATENTASRYAPQLQPTTRFIADPSSSAGDDVHFCYQDRSSPSTDVPRGLNEVASGHISNLDNAEEMRDVANDAILSMETMLHEDPRRRKAFAFTISRRTMRLWYADRSQIVASEPFDFVEQPAHFVRFVLAFLHAPYENLGFDPSIIVDWDGDHSTTPQFIISVQSRIDPNDVRQYRTEELLSNTGAQHVRGRGTRVWKVRGWEKGRAIGESLVLKDCWVDSSRDVEAVTIERIHASASTAVERTALEEMLLTTVIDGKVVLSGGEVDRTPTALDTDSTKDHYRIVFKEVCETLRDATTLTSAFETIAMACKALQLLHSLGWVHRDISPGNILRFGERVKLCDLEYANDLDENKDKTTSDGCIGTPGFMAVEVVGQDYMFTPPDPSDDGDADAVIENIRELIASAVCDVMTFEPIYSAPPKTPPPPEPWFYNPLHDVESILWLIFWFLFTNDVVCEPQQTPSSDCKPSGSVETDERRTKRIIEHFNLSHSLFDDCTGRVGLMCTNILPRFLRSHPLHPAISYLSTPVIKMWKALVATYRKVEEDTTKIDRTCAGGVCDVFNSELERCIKFLRALPANVVLRSLSDEARKLPPSSRLRLDVDLDPPEPFEDAMHSRDSGDDDDDDNGRPSKRQRMHDGGSHTHVAHRALFTNVAATTRQQPVTVEKPVVAPTNGRVLRSQTRYATAAARVGDTFPQVGFSAAGQMMPRKTVRRT